MSLLAICTIVITHWIADFIFQDEQWAVNKSKNIPALLKHTFTYSILWFVPMLLFLSVPAALVFVLITFLFHTITDYYTSKVVSARFANNHYGSSIPNLGAFSMIGLDQVLHYLQLFILFYLLI